MSTETLSLISREVLDQAFDYKTYNLLLAKLLETGKTSDGDQRESMLEYTRLNMHRTRKWDQKGLINQSLTDLLANYPRKMIWLVITEGWCGDASQVIPFLNKMAEGTSAIDLKIIFRNEHPEIMEEFMTPGLNGMSYSIPIVIGLDAESLEVLGSWGSRPAAIKEHYLNMLRNPEIANADATKELYLWYARDKGLSFQAEFEGLLKQWI